MTINCVGLTSRLVLADLVHVLIVTPAKQNVVQTTVWLVDTVLGVQLGVVVIGVSLEGVGVDNLVGKLAAHDESVADNIPLTVGTEEAEKLAEIVD